MALKVGCIIELLRKLLEILKPGTYQSPTISTSLGVGQPIITFFEAVQVIVMAYKFENNWSILCSVNADVA